MCGVVRPLTDFHKCGSGRRRSDCGYCRNTLSNPKTNAKYCGGDTSYAGWNTAQKRSPLSSVDLRDGLTISEVVEETRHLYERRDRLNAMAGNCHAWHVDHIIPIAEGGKHRAYNLRVITGGENISRWHDEKGQDIDYAAEYMDDEQLEAYETALLEALTKEIEDESNIHRPHGH